MADNTVLSAGAGGDTIASDDVAGVKHQRVKVEFGVDGVATDVSASDPLPVTVIASALPTGAATETTVAAMAGDLGDSADAEAASGNGSLIAIAKRIRTLLGPWTPSRVISAASTNATNVKGSAGTVGFIHAINLNAAVRYLKFYNKATSPTVGTDTPILTLPIPASTTGAGFVIPVPVGGIDFTTGISLALTTGIADADTGAVAANEITVNLGYR
jgi:hypothetical protein